MSEEKPVVYLLPGLLCDRTIWRDQVVGLAEQFDVRVPDYRDCDSIGAMAQVVLEAAPPQFALAGHSMGGRVALEIVRQKSQRITRLALLDTAAGPAAAAEYDKRMAWVRLAEEQGMKALAGVWLPPMLHPDRVHDKLLVGELEAMIQDFTPAQFAGQIRALLRRPDAVPVLGRVSCPALVICGRQDAWRTVEQHAELASRIPGAALEVIEDCGHMSTVERPVEVTALLRRFFARDGVPARAGRERP